MKMKKLLWWFLMVAFLFSVGWLFLFSDFTRIKKLTVNGEDQEKRQTQNLLEQLMKEKRFRYLPNDNVFLFPTKKAEKILKENLPLIKSVFWQRKFPDSLMVSLENRQEVFIWCFEEDCYWLDGQGDIFWGPQTVETAEKTGYILIRGQDDQRAKIGEKIFSQEFVGSVFELIKLLKNNNYFGDINSFFSPDIASEEIRVSFADGWQAFFVLNESALSLQVKTLQEILEEKLKDVAREKIEYIDLRLSGKAIFKLKE